MSMERLNRVDARFWKWSERRFGTGPMASLKGGALGVGVVAVVVIPAMLLSGTRLHPVAMLAPLAGAVIGLLAGTLFSLVRQVERLSTEVAQLRADTRQGQAPPDELTSAVR